MRKALERLLPLLAALGKGAKLARMIPSSTLAMVQSTVRWIGQALRFDLFCSILVLVSMAEGAVRAETTLISTGSVWKYLADGSNQGTTWRQLTFDDSMWSAGPAQLGYGDNDEGTVIALEATNKPVTTYFRRTFALSDRRSFTNLTIRLLRDDGGVVYLNGQEIFRSNMPLGLINYLTPAASAVTGSSENRFYQGGAYAGYLLTGQNVVAVELHQNDAEDCSFDLELIGNLPLTPPMVSITNFTDGALVDPGTITIVADASDADGSIFVVEFFANGNYLGTSATEPYSFVWPQVPPGRYALQAKATDNSGRRTWSPTVHIQVGQVEGTRIIRGPYLQAGTPTSMTVRWRTDWFTESLVRFGTTGALDSTTVDSSLTTEHEIQLMGLAPDTTYFYAIGSADNPLAAGSTYFFRTTPTNTRPTRIWVIGDSGTANENAAAVRDAYQAYTGERYTDLWLMLGDNAYEEGTDDQYQQAVFEMYPDLLRQTVLWPTIGNHDAPFGESGQIPYLDIFTLPTRGEAGGLASGTEKYYSFDYANIHFICLDANTSSRLRGGAMLDWLESDLAATSKDWIIAFWHQPPYSKGTHNSDDERDLIEMRENALPILENYGVDLVLSGHSHVYERSYLLNGHYGYSSSLIDSMALDWGDGREDDTGPYQKPAGGLSANQGAVYIVCGCSGEGALFSFPKHPAMAFNFSGHGSVVLDVDGDRLEAKFLRDTGSIDDYFTIRKGLPGESVRPKLEITRAATQAIIKWPTSLAPFLLEERDEMVSSANWKNIDVSPTTVGRKNVVNIDLGSSNKWFRLRNSNFE